MAYKQKQAKENIQIIKEELKGFPMIFHASDIDRRPMGWTPVKKKKNKWKDEFVVQGNYGQGWEDVTSEDTHSEARQRLKEYNENETMYGHRLITRKVMNT